jgi:hypothetical protein
MDICDRIRLEEVLAKPSYQFKAVFNARGIIFLPMNRQHSETKVAGICYEDGVSGNAIAAVISPGQISIQKHPRFTVDTVKRILGELFQDGRLEALRSFTVTYQGKIIKQGRRGKQTEAE